MKTKIITLLLCLPLIGFSQDGPFSYMDNNIQREFYLHIPNNLPPNSPIVYVLHGWGGSGASIMSTTDFNTLSDQNNFAVCYPTGLNGVWDADGFSDIDFIMALNDSLQIEYQFDITRVFATGFSYGAEMSYHLANCQTTNIFAAIAPVGGAMWDYINNGWPIVCTPSINISVFVLNGTNDNEFNYSGGYYPGVGNYLSVDSAISFWVNYNSCSFNSSFTLADINNDSVHTEVTKYYNINTGEKVWLYKVNNGTHEWFDISPSGNDDFWASEEIWNFFAQVSNNQTGLNNESYNSNKNLLKVVDNLGREVKDSRNNLLFYIYDDGTVEKKIVIE